MNIWSQYLKQQQKKIIYKSSDLDFKVQNLIYQNTIIFWQTWKFLPSISFWWSEFGFVEDFFVSIPRLQPVPADPRALVLPVEELAVELGAVFPLPLEVAFETEGHEPWPVGVSCLPGPDLWDIKSKPGCLDVETNRDRDRERP